MRAARKPARIDGAAMLEARLARMAEADPRIADRGVDADVVALEIMMDRTLSPAARDAELAAAVRWAAAGLADRGLA